VRKGKEKSFCNENCRCWGSDRCTNILKEKWENGQDFQDPKIQNFDVEVLTKFSSPYEVFLAIVKKEVCDEILKEYRKKFNKI
jgi:hypothetical protein